ncbi:MAG: sigma factor-like helix-turn-helix DNA-binding protein [Thermodesulfobacteriota bacterium]
MDIIDKALSEPSEKYRIVFHLKDIEELSNEKVSEFLEISLGAVNAKLHRSRLFVRDKISDDFL